MFIFFFAITVTNNGGLVAAYFVLGTRRLTCTRNGGRLYDAGHKTTAATIAGNHQFPCTQHQIGGHQPTIAGR